MGRRCLCGFDGILDPFFWRFTASTLVHRYKDLSGRAVDEARPDEHGRIYRKPRPFSRSWAGGIHCQHTSEVFHQRNDREMHSEVLGGGSAARGNRSPPEDGISYALGLLACGTAP